MSIFRYWLSKIQEQERERFFLWAPVVFAAGILFYFSLSFEPSLWWSALAIELLIVSAYLWRYHSLRLAVLGWCAIFVLGFANIQVRAYYLNRIPLLKTEQTLYLKGYIAQTGYNYRGKQYIILDYMRTFENEPIVGKYRLTPLHVHKPLNIGECVETVAVMRPLMLPNLENAYQYNRQQFFNGIKATGYSDVSVTQIPCEEIDVRPSKIFSYIEKIRVHIVQHIYTVLPKDTASVAAAVIAGERGHISHQETENYRNSGLAHFLAISGLHMGMIAGAMFLLVRFVLSLFPIIALRYDIKKIAAVFAILISFVYLIISGWQISTQRAFIMTTLVLLGVLVGRQAISMRMIAWAGLILLILEPQVIISAGFQMSFAAVIMLVAFYEKYARTFFSLEQSMQSHNYIFKFFCKIVIYVVGIVVADFIASTATLPFIIYHFNRVSVYTSLANLLAGPIIGLWIMPLVLVILLLMPFGLYKYPLLLAGRGIECVNDITRWVSHLDYASWPIMSMPTWGLVTIVVGGLWLALWTSRWRHWGWVFIGIGFLSILSVQKPLLVADEGAVTFAVQDKQGKMVILPNRGNYFTKQLWHEKFAEPSFEKNIQKQLTDVYRHHAVFSNWIDLRCDDECCLYQKNVKLFKQGGLVIDGHDYTTDAPVSVYLRGRRFKIIKIYETFGKRYWTDVK